MRKIEKVYKEALVDNNMKKRGVTKSIYSCNCSNCNLLNSKDLKIVTI